MLLVDPVAAAVSCETSYTYKYARECNTDIWYRYNLIRDGSSVSPQFPSANSNVRHLASCSPPRTVEEGGIASCFC